MSWPFVRGARALLCSRLESRQSRVSCSMSLSAQEVHVSATWQCFQLVDAIFVI